MLFNSVHFLFFFPIVVTSYFLLPHRFRWLLLLLASCYFYMAFIPAYILILFVTITVDYFSGIFIEKNQGKQRRLFLLASILTNCGMLFFFKYFNFFNHSFAALAAKFGLAYSVPDVSILLPIGLSFHTFQSLSYVIEVYRGHQKAERRYGILALYVLFFPQLVAGPIERPQNLLHQFDEPHFFDYDRIRSGLQLMIWGLFKKVVIADRLAAFADPVFDNPTHFQGLPLIIATIAFTFQIYCDFSGYSDMAIGAARVMGFKLMQNFKRPYFAQSISEFWRRWHISLSTWFKDYLYIPLGGNRTTVPRWCFNILLVFLVSGLWHGANWTFVVWGGLHGFYLVFSRLTENLRKKGVSLLGLNQFPRLLKTFRMGLTFVLVAITWVFFRAHSVEEAFYIIKHMADGISTVPSLGLLLHSLGTSLQGLSLVLGMIALLQFLEAIRERRSLGNVVNSRPFWLRWALYYATILVIIFFGKFEASPFIYFQF